MDVTEHELVPPHRALGKEEAVEVLTRMKISRDKLPLLKRSDAVAKFLGLQVGQVIEIRRASEAVGVSLGYRCVV